jgi:hypothetical protein
MERRLAKISFRKEIISYFLNLSWRGKMNSRQKRVEDPRKLSQLLQHTNQHEMMPNISQKLIGIQFSQCLRVYQNSIHGIKKPKVQMDRLARDVHFSSLIRVWVKLSSGKYHFAHSSDPIEFEIS